jgi:predicted DNA-binding protein with PD1-like motif
MTILSAQSSEGKFYALRLHPDEDMRQGLIRFAIANKIKAGTVVTCVGSLKQVNLRFANQETGQVFNGFHEIVSLVGTFSDESSHLHLSVSDSTGRTLGGHLLDGNYIYTTAEIVVVDLEGIEFSREMDSTFGYHELTFRKRRKP